MRHFKRVCKLTFTGEAGTESIEGLRVKFEIKKLYGNNGSTAKHTIYNLPERLRNRLARPRNMGTVPILVGPIDTLLNYAGYDGLAGVIHRGVVVQAINTRDGNTWRTELETSATYEQIMNNFVPGTYKDSTVSAILDGLFRSLAFKTTAPFYQISPEAEQRLAGKRQNLSVTRPWPAIVQILDDYGLAVSFNDLTPLITVEGKPMNDTELGTLYDVANGLKGSPTITPLGVDINVQLDPGANVAQNFRVASRSLTSTLQRKYPNASEGVRYWATAVSHSGDTRGQKWDTKITGWYLENVDYATLDATLPRAPAAL